MIRITHNEFEAEVRFYTHEEIKIIDLGLPPTGAAQNSGYYFDELEDGQPQRFPVGPFASAAEAIEAFKEWVS